MRRCEYCEAPLPEGKRPDARYCDDLCRRAGWAERTGYRSGNGRERLARPRSGRSGLQVSYRKAVAVAAEVARVAAGREYLELPRCPELIAEQYMREALSPAQRARLEQRS